MKIAHLTLMHGFNYGGILQAFATQAVLKAHGHTVTTVDYHPARKAVLLRRMTGNQAWLHRPIRRAQDRRKFSGVREFEEFRSTCFDFGKPCYKASQLAAACRDVDAVAVGSDQVWSASWLRPAYFLDFPLAAGVKRISLAACCGHPSADPAYRAYLKKTLSRFDTISVRNDFTADLVAETTGTRPAMICDPTIAHDFGKFPPPVEGPYILVYIINRRNDLRLAAEIITQLKQQTGYRVISITPAELKGAESLPADDIAMDISPLDWVNLIANAEGVVTDSFHGCVFSAKYHRDFIFADASGESVGRISSFLDDLKLNQLRVRKTAELATAVGTPVDWAAVDQRLDEHKAGYHAFVAAL